ncbi:MAG: TRAM domain-containing protein [Candidatus Aenigmarchaeota archaeon]|nr:TRAM domain-containing protein [Candidatus Aenigmarchaeota archaeon]
MERRGRGGGRGGFGRRDDRGGRGGFGGGGRGFGGGGFDRPKPIKVGEEYDVKITDVGAKGDGITRVENFIVFVPGAKKGDEIRIRIKELARSFAIGEKIGEGSKKQEDEEEKEETEEAEETEEESEEESESEEEE